MDDQLAIDFEEKGKMEVHERMVYNCLAKGRGRARSVDQIRRLTGLTGIEVRQIIRRLIMDHNLLVASATSPPAGYYIAETPEQIK